MSLKQLTKDNKLAPNYYGPYKVLLNNGSMAYKLEFLASSWVHLDFHIFFLKKVIRDKIPIKTTFAKLDKEGKVILEPKKIIEAMTRKLRTCAITKTSSSGGTYK